MLDIGSLISYGIFVGHTNELWDVNCDKWIVILWNCDTSEKDIDL